MNNNYIVSLIIILGSGIFTLSHASSLDRGEPQILSAYFGLADAEIPRGNLRQHLMGSICGVDGKLDGMPLVVNYEIDQRTLQARDFLITTESGLSYRPRCAQLAPANEEDEDRTILLLGNLGSSSDQPKSIEIVGRLMTEADDNGVKHNLRGLRSPSPVRLDLGPALVAAEPVSLVNRPIGEQECDGNTKQIIRLIWNGGVTQFNTNPNVFPPGAGEELSEPQYARIWVTVIDTNSETRLVNPVFIGDRDDGDNNNELCLDTADRAMSVFVEANTVTDPGNDYNAETFVEVSYQD